MVSFFQSYFEKYSSLSFGSNVCFEPQVNVKELLVAHRL